MPDAFVKFHQVSFSYDAATEALFHDVTFHLAPGWSGVVGANGAGKTTLLKLAAGLLMPVSGAVEKPFQVVYCAQRTDEPPDAFPAFVHGRDKASAILKGRLGIGMDWAGRWDTLSHGERKRGQIGVALWQAPHILAIDEPTNHVDMEARQLLHQALSSFTGVGILVCHDRQLLDTLCRQCLFLAPPRIEVYKGGYTRGKMKREEARQAISKQHHMRKKALKKLKQEAGRRRDSANQADRKRSKKKLAGKDHDAKSKIDAARVTGKDGVGGKLLRQLDGRLRRAQKELSDVRVSRTYSMGIWVDGEKSKRNSLLMMDKGHIRLGESLQLEHPRLVVRPDHRIGITGPNGAGKSALLKALLPRVNLPYDRITYVPQEISLAGSGTVLAQARRLPPDRKGQLMTIVSCLGSRPGRLLESDRPSPGETRKLLLAMGIVQRPHLIVMDEPTNHMDLASIECLESALSQCPCTLMLVSHDLHFIRHLTRERWHIEKRLENINQLAVGLPADDDPGGRRSGM